MSYEVKVDVFKTHEKVKNVISYEAKVSPDIDYISVGVNTEGKVVEIHMANKNNYLWKYESSYCYLIHTHL